MGVLLLPEEWRSSCLGEAGIPLAETKESGVCMIVLNTLRDESFTLNCDMIETVQENPDTTITLNNGKIYIVRESMQEVIDKSVAYHRQIFLNKTETISREKDE